MSARPGWIQSAAAKKAAKAEETARQHELYGKRSEDVLFLRQRGYMIVRNGAGFQVDNKILIEAELGPLAARERRVAGTASPGTEMQPKRKRRGTAA